MAQGNDAAQINTYHCVCTTLILATHYEVSKLSTRKGTADGAYILPLPSSNSNATSQAISALHNLTPERKPVVIKKDDGFEKRMLLRCQRCDLVVGYKLDESHFGGARAEADSIVYILPGSLISTEDMKVGRAPPTPSWAQAV